MKFSKDYLKNLDAEEHHVLVCGTGAALPFSFITHLYLVTVSGGEINRYDVIHHSEEESNTRNYLYKNYYQPDEGILFFYRKRGKGEGLRSQPRVIEHLSYKDTEMVKQIDEVCTNYPYRNNYKFWWPNCNTFVAWILQEVGIQQQLPWNALGKAYAVKDQ